MLILPINMNQYANDFTETVRVYYDDLKKYKPLTKAKERRLLKKCKKGNLKAKNEILEANLRFVFDIAKHYTGRGVPISELISDGNMGLLRAIDKFDESKNVKFISYAVWWIRQAMLESIKKKNAINFVEIEPNTDNDSYIDKRLIEDDEDDTSFNKELSNENDEKSKEISENQRNIITNIIGTLSDRERDIIENYYGLNSNKELTLSEIGKKYNLSSERVRQIKLVSLRKLRSKILLYDDLEDLFV
jgi:RNA polymerase primary sigma factor